MAHPEPGSWTRARSEKVEAHVIRVVVVDDHPALARGVQLSLQRAEDIEVVGVLNRPREVLAAVKELLPDIVLMDVRMPQREGIDLLIKIRSAMPQVKVIMLSASGDPQDIRQAMHMGAYGYVSKNIAWNQLIPIVRWAQQEQVVISRQALDPVLGHRSLDEMALSEREVELLRLRVEADNLKDLAHRASMAPSTLSRSLDRIQRKLGVRTPFQAVAIAVSYGFIWQRDPSRGEWGSKEHS